jgi:hypothetical protein
MHAESISRASKLRALGALCGGASLVNQTYVPILLSKIACEPLFCGRYQVAGRPGAVR